MWMSRVVDAVSSGFGAHSMWMDDVGVALQGCQPCM